MNEWKSDCDYSECLVDETPFAVTLERAATTKSVVFYLPNSVYASQRISDTQRFICFLENALPSFSIVNTNSEIIMNCNQCQI